MSEPAASSRHPHSGCLPTGTSSEKVDVKSAGNTLREEPVNGVTGGIDWGRDDHALSVVDARGREIDRCTFEHSTTGLRQLCAMFARHGIGEVATERPDGPVVDALLAASLTGVVINPIELKNFRGRYELTGIKGDRCGAYVVADTLRTDRTWR